MTIIKKTRDNNNRQGCGVGRNVNWCNHHGKPIWKIFKKSKIEYYVIQQSHFWVFILRTWNPYLKEISTLLCSLQRLYPIQVCTCRMMDRLNEWIHEWRLSMYDDQDQPLDGKENSSSSSSFFFFSILFVFLENVYSFRRNTDFFSNNKKS